jgi:hypothetical protein
VDDSVATESEVEGETHDEGEDAAVPADEESLAHRS